MALDLSLTPVAGIWVAFAIGALALTAVVLKARPITRSNAVLAAILVQQAAGTVASIVAFTGTDGGTRVLGFHLGVPIWLLWSPLIFLAGPMLLGNAPHVRRWLALGIAGCVPNVAMLLLLLAAPGAVFVPGGLGLTEVAATALLLVFVGFAATAWALAREALTTPLPTRRAQLALLASAFTVEGMFHATQGTAQIALGLRLGGAAHATPLESAVVVLPFLLFVALVVYAARVLLTRSDPDRSRWAAVLVGFLGAAAVTGAATAPVAVGEEFQSPFGAFHALWDLAGLCLITFAGLRFQLFGIERRAQQGIAVSAAVAIGFLSFELLNQFLQDLIEANALTGLPEPGYISAIVVAVAGLPITKLASRVSKRVLPDVSDSAAYEQKRRQDIYRAALEGAFADGITTPKESALLRTLRAQLHLSEEEHEEMELQVRAVLAAPPSPA